MAVLTPAERSTLLSWFGYPFRSLDPTSRNYNSIIGYSFDQLADEELVYIREKLEEIRDLDDRIRSARIRLAAKKIDDIETNADELRMLRNERNRLIKEIAGNLDIAMNTSGGSMMSSVIV